MRRRRVLLIVGAVVAVLTAALLASSRSQFILGGALVNAGYRLQDHLHAFDLEHDHDITPDQVWKEFLKQNALAASVRKSFPRSTNHPVIAMLVCMDARIDTNELAGDTRRYYYVVRTAGSVMGPPEQDMLDLAVANGVKLIILTRHTDCAAEKIAADQERRKAYPDLVAGVEERDQRIAEFLKRPLIAERIASGALVVKQALIDTASEHVIIEGSR